MGMQRTQGFTILETMLFLGITGILILTMLTGIGVSLNTQRYRDSVQSLKSQLQDQYSQVLNVTNDHDNSWKCNASAQISQGGNGSGLPRGQSDCVLLGRYITIDQDTVTVENVVGSQIDTTIVGDDVQLLKANYVMDLATSSRTISTLEWGAKIAYPTSGTGSKPSGTPRSIGILLVQSPDSGIVYTFTVDSPKDIASTTGADLATMMVTGDNVSQPSGGTTLRGQSQQTVCVDPSGFVTFGGTSVVLQSFAANDTGVQTQSNDILSQTYGSGAPQC